ncbi:membrane-associated protein, putative [Bodo saltans]|uniref:Membrane-associated protein, putative n=1 Tax=Bodo saltans TaxID=75058 RepID=A0A0S4IQ97_BODSA|nr:membrane-associated protein, putative [Bodo saltans]|eukprot:CUF94279.1 membrane-associated protein, putative [Bodo saltans]
MMLKQSATAPILLATAFLVGCSCLLPITKCDATVPFVAYGTSVGDAKLPPFVDDDYYGPFPLATPMTFLDGGQETQYYVSSNGAIMFIPSYSYTFPPVYSPSNGRLIASAYGDLYTPSAASGGVYHRTFTASGTAMSDMWSDVLPSIPFTPTAALVMTLDNVPDLAGTGLVTVQTIVLWNTARTMLMFRVKSITAQTLIFGGYVGPTGTYLMPPNNKLSWPTLSNVGVPGLFVVVPLELTPAPAPPTPAPPPPLALKTATPASSPSASPSSMLSFSETLSISETDSFSLSMSLSAAVSLSYSLSVSQTDSYSLSTSPSMTPSQSRPRSLSVSETNSFSLSTSPSTTLSLSHSFSISEIDSFSLSTSTSATLSLSHSFSISEIDSFSLSTSTSVTLALSRSHSLSVSESDSFLPSTSPTTSSTLSCSRSVSEFDSLTLTSKSSTLSLSYSTSVSQSESFTLSVSLSKTVSISYSLSVSATDSFSLTTSPSTFSLSRSWSASISASSTMSLSYSLSESLSLSTTPSSTLSGTHPSLLVTESHSLRTRSVSPTLTSSDDSIPDGSGWRMIVIIAVPGVVGLAIAFGVIVAMKHASVGATATSTWAAVEAPPLPPGTSTTLPF